MSKPQRPILTDTGERAESLPVCRIGNPDQWKARERRNQSLDAILRAECRGEPVMPAMRDEAWEAKVELFRVMGWGTPKLRDSIQDKESAL